MTIMMNMMTLMMPVMTMMFRISIDSSRLLSNPSWRCSFPIETRRQTIGCAPWGHRVFTVQRAVPHKNTHTQKMHNYTNTQMHKNTKASQSRAGANASVALLRGSAPQPCPISEPPNPIREPSSPLYLKPPSYAPPYITLYPCPAPPIWSPSDRGVELGAPPGDNNGSSVLKWRQITMLFNGSPETQNLQKQTMGGTLKAQSVHQRCRKVSATMG